MDVFTILKNRNFLGLLTANTVLASAFPMQLILGGLAGLALAPTPLFATLPTSVQSLAALLAAAPLSILMGRFGRRAGFALGGALTVLGAGLATWALFTQSFVLLCLAHFLMGAGWAAFQYFRFAAGEVVDPVLQPVAISFMLTSGLVAAIIGPELFTSTRAAIENTPLAGAYAALAPLSLIGMVPLLLVRMARDPNKASAERSESAPVISIFRRRPVQRAIGMAAVSQGVMVFLMVPTPLAMVGSGHGEDMASDVIRWHLIAMFAPSFITGFLIQRFGAQLIAISGLVTIALAGAAAMTGLSPMHFYGSLIVLGIGWNFSFVGATTMLAAAVPPAEATGVQGANDTLIALSSVVASFASGLVIAALGWGIVTAASVGCILLGLAALWLFKTNLETE
ncbi:MAG: MFS transporter [Pseudomonadota bacterium]